jgi:ankyrin repeat protein
VIINTPVHWTIFERHNFVICCPLILPAGGEYPCKQHVPPMKTELHYRIVCGTKLPVSLLLCINLSPQEHLKDCCAICCMLALLQVLPFTKKWTAQLT